MNKYKVQYKQRLVTRNEAIRKNAFSCITFENIGDDDATINNVIPLPANAYEVREFNEHPSTIIDSQFEVRFSGKSPNQRVLIIEAYYYSI